MGFSRQEYWSGWPIPSPGYLPDPEIKLGSPALQADSLLSEPPEKPKTPPNIHQISEIHEYSKELLPLIAIDSI